MRVLLADAVTDGVHQVGLAETDAAIDEERVVLAGRNLGDRARGGVRELVRRADDEGVEGVLGEEVGRGAVLVSGLRVDGPSCDFGSVVAIGTGVGSRSSDSASRTSNRISKSWFVCARSASSTID